MSEKLCLVCRHRAPNRGHVCDTDRKQIEEQLADLSRKLGALTYELVPGGGGPSGDRVATSRTGSPAGARLDALTLTAPGSDGISRAALDAMTHPQIRRWQETYVVTVTVVEQGVARQEEREIRVWQREQVRDDAGRPVLAVDDDQVGLLPPREWLDSWARAWRKRFGTHVGQPARGAAKDAATAARAMHGLEAVAVRQHAANVVLGLRGRLPYTERPDDPLVEEWSLRFGDPGRPAHSDDIAYLLTWLDRACDDDDCGVDDFAIELRALTAELARVLGESNDHQWLGRCPTVLTDRETRTSRPCGAGLWQDPYATRVVCPRCRSTWGPAVIALLRLATSIRQTWPVDRRRRYTAAEIDELTPAMAALRCPRCDGPVGVEWADVTAPGDRWRTWRPTHAACESGCADAEGVI